MFSVFMCVPFPYSISDFCSLESSNASKPKEMKLEGPPLFAFTPLPSSLFGSTKDTLLAVEPYIGAIKTAARLELNERPSSIFPWSLFSFSG